MRVLKEAPSRREALDALFRIYRANNDLTELYRIAQRLHEIAPNENNTAATYARLALLLDRNTAEGHRVAQETYAAAPTDPNAAATYAFSLYNLGRSAEGLETLRKLPAEQLKDPHTAIYMAILLLDENQVATAQEYIAAARAGSIFPEEKKLLDEAIAKDRGSPPEAIASPTASAMP